jgi:hypothetical protein
MFWQRFVPVLSLAAVLSALLLTPPVPAEAQALLDRHRIELKLGFGARTNSGTNTDSQGVQTDTEASGMLGSVGYHKWIREELAVGVSVGLLAVDAGTTVGAGGVETSTSLVLPLFLGARYYLPRSTLGGKYRPYLSAEGGPLLGFDSATEVGDVVQSGTSSSATIGSRFGGGLDVQVADHFMIDLFAAYGLMADFGSAIGGQKNHSGWEFGLGLGVVWGGDGD